MTENTLPVAATAIKEITVAEMSENLLKLIEGNSSTLGLTGFAELDKYTGGWKAGELYVVGGRPGMGKTALLLNMLLHLAEKQNISSSFISFEMNTEMMLERLLQLKCQMHWKSHQYATLESTEKEKIKEAVNSFTSIPLHLFQANDAIIHDLVDTIDKCIVNYQSKIIFVDYLQAIYPPGRKQQVRDEEIGYILRKLKKIAVQKNICLVLSSAISRGVENRGGDKVPLLCDLRESGKIEENADKIIFIYRPEYYGITEDEYGQSNLGRTKLFISKNNRGPLGIVNIMYELQTGRFMDPMNLDLVDFKSKLMDEGMNDTDKSGGYDPF